MNRRHHNPIDASCSSLEAEDIPPSDFTGQVLDAMRTYSLTDLSRLFPELTFQASAAKPLIKADFQLKVGRRWVLAHWRCA